MGIPSATLSEIFIQIC